MREEVPKFVRPWLWLLDFAAIEQSSLLKKFLLILVREEVIEFLVPEFRRVWLFAFAAMELSFSTKRYSLQFWGGRRSRSL